MKAENIDTDVTIANLSTKARADKELAPGEGKEAGSVCPTEKRPLTRRQAGGKVKRKQLVHLLHVLPLFVGFCFLNALAADDEPPVGGAKRVQSAKKGPTQKRSRVCTSLVSEVHQG